VTGDNEPDPITRADPGDGADHPGAKRLEFPASGEDPAPDEGRNVDERDIHGKLRQAGRGVDVEYVKQNGDLNYQDDGQLVRVLDNGDGTSDVAIYDPSNPSGGQTTVIKGKSNPSIKAAIESGRWR
jgi:hypothetical protein